MADKTQPAGALPELVAESAPERIWLVIGEDCPADVRFDSLEGVTWCQDKIDDNSIEYVHADVAQALRADRESWRGKAHRTDLLAEKLMAERDAALKTGSELLDSLTQANAAALALISQRDALRRELEELRAVLKRCRDGFVSESATGGPVLADWREQTLALIDGTHPVPPDARDCTAGDGHVYAAASKAHATPEQNAAVEASIERVAAFAREGTQVAWKHDYQGACPEESQPDSRDPECAACRVLLAREGREPLTEEQIIRITAEMDCDRPGWAIRWTRAIEAAHRIGPAGTSADGETQP